MPGLTVGFNLTITGGISMKRKIAIRSLRVAKELNKRGHEVLSIEPSRKSSGFNVFFFEDCPEVQRVLFDSRRK